MTEKAMPMPRYEHISAEQVKESIRQRLRVTELELLDHTLNRVETDACRDTMDEAEHRERLLEYDVAIKRCTQRRSALEQQLSMIDSHEIAGPKGQGSQ